MKRHNFMFDNLYLNLVIIISINSFLVIYKYPIENNKYIVPPIIIDINMPAIEYPKLLSTIRTSNNIINPINKKGILSFRRCSRCNSLEQ